MSITAATDSGIVGFGTKYYYHLWRPGESSFTAADLVRVQVSRTTVVGFAIDKERRWRLDYDDRGAHINEEDFTKAPGLQKVRHNITGMSFNMVDVQWRKWSSQGG
ncbi:MAG: hypothetical protein HY820_28735 [Acidobacteria bacterium]|nr:hypothetical protein [Acidobacteriota bacterium]